MTDLTEWKDHEVESNWMNKEYVLKPSDFGVKGFRGRFHPDIPFTMMQRYTKEGETIWDPFAGGGTTADVGKLLKRNAILSDLAPARDDIIEADATDWFPEDPVQMVILHPPYWGMIDFSKDSRDLCNAPSVVAFADMFGLVIDQVVQCLDSSRMLILVISDVYKDSEQWPLDFYCHRELKEHNFRLKGRIVKDFGETQGKSQTQHRGLWHYRASQGGFWRLNLDFILVYQFMG